MIDIKKHRTASDVTSAVARDLRAVIGESIAHHGDAHIVLTGGGTGIGCLEKLSCLQGIPWHSVHIYFGDDRDVPVTHHDSNEGQARSALLNHVDIPAHNVHSMGLGDVDLDEAARRYAALLPQRFDVHLLGVGPDGHINSLFPFSAAARETEKLVVGVTDSPKPPPRRLTLTFPAIARARRVWIVASGSAKAAAVSALLHSGDAATWPVCAAQGIDETVLYVSADALTRS